MNVTYEAPCPACGETATWTSYGRNVTVMAVRTSDLTIDCGGCKSREVTRPWQPAGRG